MSQPTNIDKKNIFVSHWWGARELIHIEEAKENTGAYRVHVQIFQQTPLFRLNAFLRAFFRRAPLKPEAPLGQPLASKTITLISKDNLEQLKSEIKENLQKRRLFRNIDKESIEKTITSFDKPCEKGVQQKKPQIKQIETDQHSASLNPLMPSSVEPKNAIAKDASTDEPQAITFSIDGSIDGSIAETEKLQNQEPVISPPDSSSINKPEQTQHSPELSPQEDAAIDEALERRLDALDSADKTDFVAQETLDAANHPEYDTSSVTHQKNLEKLPEREKNEGLAQKSELLLTDLQKGGFSEDIQKMVTDFSKALKNSQSTEDVESMYATLISQLTVSCKTSVEQSIKEGKKPLQNMQKNLPSSIAKTAPSSVPSPEMVKYYCCKTGAADWDRLENEANNDQARKPEKYLNHLIGLQEAANRKIASHAALIKLLEPAWKPSTWVKKAIGNLVQSSPVQTAISAIAAASSYMQMSSFSSWSISSIPNTPLLPEFIEVNTCPIIEADTYPLDDPSFSTKALIVGSAVTGLAAFAAVRFGAKYMKEGRNHSFSNGMMHLTHEISTSLRELVELAEISNDRDIDSQMKALLPLKEMTIENFGKGVDQILDSVRKKVNNNSPHNTLNNKFQDLLALKDNMKAVANAHDAARKESLEARYKELDPSNAKPEYQWLSNNFNAAVKQAEWGSDATLSKVASDDTHWSAIINSQYRIVSHLKALVKAHTLFTEKISNANIFISTHGDDNALNKEIIKTLQDRIAFDPHKTLTEEKSISTYLSTVKTAESNLERRLGQAKRRAEQRDKILKEIEKAESLISEKTKSLKEMEDFFQVHIKDAHEIIANARNEIGSLRNSSAGISQWVTSLSSRKHQDMSGRPLTMLNERELRQHLIKTAAAVRKVESNLSRIDRLKEAAKSYSNKRDEVAARIAGFKHDDQDPYAKKYAEILGSPFLVLQERLTPKEKTQGSKTVMLEAAADLARNGGSDFETLLRTFEMFYSRSKKQMEHADQEINDLVKMLKARNGQLKAINAKISVPNGLDTSLERAMDNLGLLQKELENKILTSPFKKGSSLANNAQRRAPPPYDKLSIPLTPKIWNDLIQSEIIPKVDENLQSLQAIVIKIETKIKALREATPPQYIKAADLEKRLNAVNVRQLIWEELISKMRERQLIAVLSFNAGENLEVTDQLAAWKNPYLPSFLNQRKLSETDALLLRNQLVNSIYEKIEKAMIELGEIKKMLGETVTVYFANEWTDAIFHMIDTEQNTLDSLKNQFGFKKFWYLTQQKQVADLTPEELRLYKQHVDARAASVQKRISDQSHLLPLVNMIIQFEKTIKEAELKVQELKKRDSAEDDVEAEKLDRVIKNIRSALDRFRVNDLRPIPKKVSKFLPFVSYLPGTRNQTKIANKDHMNLFRLEVQTQLNTLTNALAVARNAKRGSKSLQTVIERRINLNNLSADGQKKLRFQIIQDAKSRIVRYEKAIDLRLNQLKELNQRHLLDPSWVKTLKNQLEELKEEIAPYKMGRQITTQQQQGRYSRLVGDPVTTIKEVRPFDELSHDELVDYLKEIIGKTTTEKNDGSPRPECPLYSFDQVSSLKPLLDAHDCYLKQMQQLDLLLQADSRGEVGRKLEPLTRHLASIAPKIAANINGKRSAIDSISLLKSAETKIAAALSGMDHRQSFGISAAGMGDDDIFQEAIFRTPHQIRPTYNRGIWESLRAIEARHPQTVFLTSVEPHAIQYQQLRNQILFGDHPLSKSRKGAVLAATIEAAKIGNPFDLVNNSFEILHNEDVILEAAIAARAIAQQNMALRQRDPNRYLQLVVHTAIKTAADSARLNNLSEINSITTLGMAAGLAVHQLLPRQFETAYILAGQAAKPMHRNDPVMAVAMGAAYFACVLHINNAHQTANGLGQITGEASIKALQSTYPNLSGAEIRKAAGKMAGFFAGVKAYQLQGLAAGAAIQDTAGIINAAATAARAIVQQNRGSNEEQTKAAAAAAGAAAARIHKKNHPNGAQGELAKEAAIAAAFAAASNFPVPVQVPPIVFPAANLDQVRNAATSAFDAILAKNPRESLDNIAKACATAATDAAATPTVLNHNPVVGSIRGNLTALQANLTQYTASITAKLATAGIAPESAGLLRQLQAKIGIQTAAINVLLGEELNRLVSSDQLADYAHRSMQECNKTLDQIEEAVAKINKTIERPINPFDLIPLPKEFKWNLLD